jgi:hypothetical protein
MRRMKISYKKIQVWRDQRMLGHHIFSSFIQPDKFGFHNEICWNLNDL